MEQQLPSGPTGRQRRPTDTAAALAGGICWVAAGQQGPHEDTSVAHSTLLNSPLSVFGGVSVLQSSLSLTVQLEELSLQHSKLLLQDEEQT